MNITCISTSRIPSDTANSIQVMKTCHALAGLGHTVCLLVPVTGQLPADPHLAEWPALAERYGLEFPFEINWLPAHPRLQRNDFAWTAVRKIAAHRAVVAETAQDSDLVYTWTAQSAVFALLHRYPVAFEVHDLPAGRLGPLWFRAILRLPGRKRLLPITQALLTRLVDRFGTLPPDQVVIAPNGVDLEPYQNLPDGPAARRELNLPEAQTVTCSGHLYAGRGVELFLGLARCFPSASFVWVGGRPQEVTEFQSRARVSGLSNVTFTGFVNQRRLPCYQAAADVLLMPYARAIAGSSGGNSADICSPMKMFDYLAAGRAILTSDLPVIHEVLNPSNAVFAPPEDLAGWQSALGRLLADRSLRERLAAQARVDADRYTWRERAERALAGFVA